MLKTLLSVFVGLLAVAHAQFDWGDVTALDQYVQRDSGDYSYEVLVTHRYNSSTVYVVNMTSQKWYDETFVDRPWWYHIMSIAVPDPENMTFPDTAALVIAGGSNDPDDAPPDREDGTNLAVAAACVDVGMTVAYMGQVPNQPLYFADEDDVRRSEDDIIAYTWRYFIDQGRTDPEVILRMPMTKAAKRGLDTINNVVRENHIPAEEITKFIPLGASKRGWTTWSLAATDQRVIAFAPLVFSMLNFNETLQAHFRSLGGAWSFAFGPYWELDLTKELMQPYVDDLFQHEDMWWYRPRFNKPLLQSTSSGDEFFLLQDSHQWWDDIPGPKWNVMYENAEHTMFPHYNDIYSTITGWVKSLLLNLPLPTYSWTRGTYANGTGYVTYTTDMQPDGVTAFRARTLNNDTRRDFRLASGNDTIGISIHPVLWGERNITLTETDPGTTWLATAEPVEEEWTGMMIRGEFTGPDDKRMYFTSEVNVVPDTFPVEECTSADTCYGYLV